VPKRGAVVLSALNFASPRCKTTRARKANEKPKPSRRARCARTAGAGPRATPTVADDRVYALGATGVLNCLDADGDKKWAHDVAADAGAKVPIWGFAGSPLVVKGWVIVFAGGGDKSLLAYHADSGELAWAAPAGGHSCNSPQLASVGGEDQVLMLSDGGLTAVDPASGSVLWQQGAAARGGLPPSLQPHPVGKTQVVTACEAETALLDLTRDGGAWVPEQRWGSKEMKPTFNDFVVHDSFIYGFDGSVFCCVDVQTGQRRWRQGRYGNGQVLLLTDQALLLVVSERGEAVLAAANGDRLEEPGRFPAVSGKT
jgi:outer membrane protein assembly factor BamB